ncbi:prohibitin family protein [bacterium]|nr:prohibitin family protein [bacterium]
MQSLGSLFSGIVIFILVIGGMSCFHIVPPGHRGIVITLGKVSPEQKPEGLVFKMPFAQVIRDYPIMQLKADGQSASFSSDLQQMSISFSVLYRIPESQVVKLFQNYSGDPYSNLIEPRVQEGVKQVAALYRAEDLVKHREKAKNEVLERIHGSIGEVLKIEDLIITNIDLSDQLEHAIEQKVVREQEALAKSFELEKEKRQADITLVQAEAEAKAVKVKGDALKEAPRVIDLEIAQRWDGKAPLSVSVGTNSPANVLLPLSRAEDR